LAGCFRASKRRVRTRRARTLRFEAHTENCWPYLLAMLTSCTKTQKPEIACAKRTQFRAFGFFFCEGARCEHIHVGTQPENSLS